ncbi:ABC transporter permease [Blautia sp.]|uniref:ABC transporter permease n=1 Tax=Blautia sp. TaxID=1955243 RepID=UPI002E775D34|nr:ABC transporter permease subunit [Blautia sp.]MEE0809628.1 ABC transporter permease subunit [Blautia sp.]
MQQQSKKKSLLKKMKTQKYLLLLLLPGLIYFIVFRYYPMYGTVIAFKDFDFREGILGSDWVGLRYFKQFVTGPYFWRLVKNTFLVSFYDLLFSFPAPIIFALLLNEVRSKRYKKVVQTVSYLPHFISVVILVGLMKTMFSPNGGVVNNILMSMGMDPINFFMEKSWFRPLYVGSSIWQSFGWGSIIYLATMAGIDTQLYEAAHMDGAGRFRCMWNITLPCIRPTIVILLILRLGKLLSVGFEKIILMYNPATYEVSDVISSYVYRYGILQANYSFGAAVDLMNSIIALILILITNKISQKISDTSLW